MTNRANLLVLIVVLFILSGCNKPSCHFDLEPAKATIISEPSGAHVYQKWPMNMPSTYLGQTPLEDISIMTMGKMKAKNMPFSQMQQLLSHRGNIKLEVKMEGYETFHGTFGVNKDEISEYHINLTVSPEGDEDN